MPLIFSRVTPPSFHQSSFLPDAEAEAARAEGFGAVAPRPELRRDRASCRRSRPR